MPSQTATIAVVFGLSWVAHFGPVVVAIKLSQDVVVKSEAGSVASPRIGSNSVSGDAVADRVSDTVGGSFCDDGFHIQCYLAGQRQHEGRDPECGDHDDEDFTAADSCCTCGGGETYECTDTTNGGALQSSFPPNTGQPGCQFIVSRKWWEAKHGRCADFASAEAWVAEEEYNLAYDDEDFTATDMCCACGGGVRAAAATPAPTPAPTAALATAKGDPHLVNTFGQHFDLYQPGTHVLVQVPKKIPSDNQTVLLLVEAEARQLGGACAEMYFTTASISGRWVQVPGGLHFHSASRLQHLGEDAAWMTFGNINIKIAYGSTGVGVEYLNVFAKHLDRAGYRVGGLLGEDDHTVESTPSRGCNHYVDLAIKTDH